MNADSETADGRHGDKVRHKRQLNTEFVYSFS